MCEHSLLAAFLPKVDNFVIPNSKYGVGAWNVMHTLEKIAGLANLGDRTVREINIPYALIRTCVSNRGISILVPSAASNWRLALNIKLLLENT